MNYYQEIVSYLLDLADYYKNNNEESRYTAYKRAAEKLSKIDTFLTTKQEFIDKGFTVTMANVIINKIKNIPGTDLLKKLNESTRPKSDIKIENNIKISQYLRNHAEILIKDNKQKNATFYNKAADLLENYDKEIKSGQDGLLIKGIGLNISKKIDEYFQISNDPLMKINKNIIKTLMKKPEKYEKIIDIIAKINYPLTISNLSEIITLSKLTIDLIEASILITIKKFTTEDINNYYKLSINYVLISFLMNHSDTKDHDIMVNFLVFLPKKFTQEDVENLVLDESTYNLIKLFFEKEEILVLYNFLNGYETIDNNLIKSFHNNNLLTKKDIWLYADNLSNDNRLELLYNDLVDNTDVNLEDIQKYISFNQKNDIISLYKNGNDLFLEASNSLHKILYNILGTCTRKDESQFIFYRHTPLSNILKINFIITS